MDESDKFFKPKIPSLINMKQKTKSIFDSLWFNVIMSIVAVALLVINIIDKKYIMIVIWIVLTYHFIREVIKAKKRR